MLDTAIGHGKRHIGLMGPDLDEKSRRVIKRHERLNRLTEMQAPGMVVRNEKRMLKAAMDDLFDDAEVEEIISRIGVAAFTKYFNIVAATGIQSPVDLAAGAFLGAQSTMQPQAKGLVQ